MKNNELVCTTCKISKINFYSVHFEDFFVQIVIPLCRLLKMYFSRINLHFPLGRAHMHTHGMEMSYLIDLSET